VHVAAELEVVWEALQLWKVKGAAAVMSDL
jgi:hypothetical protein